MAERGGKRKALGKKMERRGGLFMSIRNRRLRLGSDPKPKGFVEYRQAVAEKLERDGVEERR